MHLEMIGGRAGGALEMTLVGELTRLDVPRFKKWVTLQLESPPREVRLDCERLQYLDSTGLGALIFLRRMAQDRGAELRLVRVSGWIEKFLRVTGLAQTFLGAERDSGAASGGGSAERAPSPQHG